MNVVPALVADRQAAELGEPGQSPFDDPAMAAEAGGGFDALASDPTADATASQVAPTAANVVALVGMELGRTLAGSAPRALDRGDRLDQLLEDDLVGDVGGGEQERARDAVAVDHQMALRARFAAIRWIRAGFGPPFLAGTLAESSDARSQSI